MNSLAHGNSISDVEVTNISSHGLWLFAHDKEMFLSYEDFPWFMEKPVSMIINIQEPTPHHFYWPDLDIDLTEEMIEHPDRFPLPAR
jgi:hypothetical protein